MKVRRLMPWGLLVVALTAMLVAALGASAAPTTSTANERISLVTDVGRLNDRSFNQLAYQGLLRAERRLRIRKQVFESRSPADYTPNLRQGATTASALTIAVGFLLASDLNTVAQQYPQRNFAIIDFAQGDLANKPRNVRGLLFNSEQAGCLVGFMAVKQLMREGRRPILSAVGGIKIPSVDSFIAGYRFCARRANRRAVVRIGYSQSFTDAAKCKEVALNHISRGANVVFQVAGGCGLGALSAAKERRKWGIGVDADQKYLGAHILTSAVKRVDESVYQSIQAIQRGTFRGGTNAFFNLRNKGVGYGKVSTRVPRSIIRQVEALKLLIIRGRVKVPAKV
ncbi:MAG TPA: BMP family ABC transporter substrate-binding protein [Gaiellaceae bacterium]|nr:BMP family ABC transporter substrate-binding protein [Gaiellaceae bacterium]